MHHPLNLQSSCIFFFSLCPHQRSFIYPSPTMVSGLHLFPILMMLLLLAVSYRILITTFPSSAIWPRLPLQIGNAPSLNAFSLSLQKACAFLTICLAPPFLSFSPWPTVSCTPSSLI